MLKKGMYVRTEKGIAKIIGKNDDVRYYYPNAYVTDTYLEINDDTEYVYEEDVIKSSHNIIDLIEVGDYVNGFRVDEVEHSKSTIFIGNTKKVIEQALWSNDIKSIVTKEQFEIMSYKIGD